MKSARDFDVAVIGAGFGGLGAALALAERGARVVLFEALNYPGGCASTFQRGGYRFEAGATLFAGLGPGQLFGQWIARYRLDVHVEGLDPVVELRTPELRLPVPAERARFVDALAELAGAPAERVRAFFAYQAEVADLLWQLMDDPALLPPLGLGGVLAHLRRTPRYARLLRLVGRPLGAVLERFGLAGHAPLLTYLEGLCQITVQCGVAAAEAPFALGAMDYYWRGAGHVRGGIGELAWALVRAFQQAGGEARLACRVKTITPLEGSGGGHRLETRSGSVTARQVVANVLPQDLRLLLGQPAGALPALDRLGERVAAGWGAAMLYLVSRTPDSASDAARHLELVADPAAPFTEGNHLFVSVSGAADPDRAPPGHRTLTISTHVPLAHLHGLPEDEQGRYIASIQARMRHGLGQLAPEWAEGIVHALTASPRTFQRFTRRAGGAVGGIPRRAGLGQYLQLFPRPVRPGLWLVGDSVLLGQSTLACALGGVRTAEALVRAL